MHASLNSLVAISLHLLSATSAVIQSALPSIPQPQDLSLISTSNTSITIPDDPIATELPTGLKCFEPGTERVQPVDADHCHVAIELILHEPTGVMTKQLFGHKQDPPNPDIYEVPSAWRVDRCLILLTSGDESAVDEFRLVDVVERAELILRDCVAFSKKRLGGVATLGLKTFFVTVDGPPDFAGEAGGNRTIPVLSASTNGSGVDVDSSLASRQVSAA